MRRITLHKSVLGITFILLAITSSYSQHGTIKGIIKSGVETLQLATVILGNISILTDHKGEYSFFIDPGTYTLIITHAGHKRIEKQVTVQAGAIQVFNFNMIPSGQLGEIVLLGSRSATHRSNLTTPVPVDVVNVGELSKTNFSDPKLMLSLHVTSFNSPPQYAGPASYIEPATLRGLAPDQMLVLVNGRRRHTMAMIYQQNTIGRGTAGTDLNSIPSIAIDKIEVLRDGAAAQYGSDAIAGVINVELKKSTAKTFIALQTGQYYKGDGEQLNLGINRGFSFFKKGFLNFSGSLYYRNPTDRTGLYNGTVYKNYPPNISHADSVKIKAMDDSIVHAKGFDRRKVAKVGVPDLLNTGIVINGGYPLNKKIDLFWTGSINYRLVKKQYAGSSYRFPKSPSQLNTEIFPDGFLSYGRPSLWDGSGILGGEGKTNKGWHWDISSVYGSNSQRFEGHNTNNASQQHILGKNAPVDFYLGTVIFRQNTNNLNFARDFAKEIGGVKSFNLGIGAEFRIDNFQIKEGEEASWNNYDPASGKQGGSQVNVGFDTSNAVKASRRVTGFYADVEVEKSDHFLFNIASRYEYYSDFGGNLAGKLAMRYKFSDMLSLRGAISNGFRAPGMQQIYFSRTNQVNRNLILKTTGTFRNNSPVVRAFEIPRLGPERSVNLSAGFTSQLTSHMSLTVDAYWIQIRNRIILTGSFDTTIAAVKTILVNYPGIEAVVFFTNAINTRTRGIDLVWTGKWNIWKGRIEISLSANFNRTRLFGEIQTSDKLPGDSKTTNTVINPEVRGIIEWGQPLGRIILKTDYTIGKLGFQWVNIYVGKTTHYNKGTDSIARALDESFSPKIISNFNIHYTPKPWLTLSLGSRNLFNVYPDPIKNSSNTVDGTQKYDFVAQQFGFDGGYFYLNMAFNF